jgi:hypothetical protein
MTSLYIYLATILLPRNYTRNGKGKQSGIVCLGSRGGDAEVTRRT